MFENLITKEELVTRAANYIAEMFNREHDADFGGEDFADNAESWLESVMTCGEDDTNREYPANLCGTRFDLPSKDDGFASHIVSVDCVVRDEDGDIIDEKNIGFIVE